MMDIVLNGEPYNTKVAGNTLGVVLDEVRSGFPKGHIVSFLFVDGQELLQNDVDSLRNLTIDEVQEINIQTASLKGELQKGLSEIVVFLNDAIPTLEDAALQIQIGEVNKGSENLSTCFEGLGMALRNMEQVYSTFPMVNVKILEEEFDLFKSLNEADLVGTVESFKEKDWDAVGTKIQSSLIPTLSPWCEVLTRSAERLGTNNQA